MQPPRAAGCDLAHDKEQVGLAAQRLLRISAEPRGSAWVGMAGTPVRSA